MTAPLTNAERVARHRRKQAADGGRLVQVWITPKDAAAMDALRKRSGMTVADIVRHGIRSADQRPRRTASP